MEPYQPSAPPPRKRPPANIQDSFLFASLKDARELAFGLVTAKALKGRILRFDRYVVLVESGGVETLLYKHAIVGITDTTA